MSVSSSDIMKVMDLVIKAGDSFSRLISVKNNDQTDYDFTSHSARMQVRKSSYDDDIELELTSASGIELVPGKIILSGTTTQTQLKPRTYCYDIEITLPSGLVQTWVGGSFTVNGDCTR